MEGEKFVFSRAIAERIKSLKSDGHSYGEIASLIGHRGGANAIAVFFWRLKNGKIKFKTEEWELGREKIASLYLGGMSMREIALKCGVTKVNIFQRLRRAGVDEEVRDELRREIKV